MKAPDEKSKIRSPIRIRTKMSVIRNTANLNTTCLRVPPVVEKGLDRCLYTVYKSMTSFSFFQPSSSGLGRAGIWIGVPGAVAPYPPLGAVPGNPDHPSDSNKGTWQRDTFSPFFKSDPCRTDPHSKYERFKQFVSYFRRYSNS